jgi:hypothetical protein
MHPLALQNANGYPALNLQCRALITAEAAQFIGPGLTTSSQITIHREGPQREVLAIPVVSQIKHPWEAGARVAYLLPRAIFSLLPEQVIDATDDADGLRGSRRQ